MQYKLIGYQKTSFQGDSGTVEGFNLYLGSSITVNGEGFNVYRQFVLKDRCPELKYGGMYECQYRRTGRLESITKVS